jgi:hypothetical protein
MKENNMRSIIISSLIIVCCIGLCGILEAGSYTFSGYLPKVIKESESLTIRIDPLKKEGDFYIYYRTDGLKKYQVRKMMLDKNGDVYYRLPTKNLYGQKMEYFIVESGQSKSGAFTPVFTVEEFTDKGSPEIYFQDGTGSGGGDGTAKKDPLIKIGLSASTTTQLHDKTDAPGPKFDANGNVRLYRNIYKDKYQFDFDTNFTYMHTVSEEESKINLSEMKIKYKRGSHAIAAGDLSIDNTEFTASGFSRRGLHYEMDGKLLYLSSFFTNSQQKTGFDGFGIPASDANVFGATAGFNLGSIFKVRGMFMMGKDNLDSKTVVSTEDAYREGSVFSVWGELNVLKNHLILKGEFARSNFGRAADSAGVNKESDTAWRGEADFNYGVVSAHADYKKVGEKYSSIANLFLQNDREGLNSNIGFVIKSFALNVRYTDQKTNLTSLVQPMLHTKNIGADVNWLIANHFQVGAEYSLDNLDYDESTGLMTGSEDMDTVRYAATLGYIAGSNGITVKIGKTESKKFTSNLDGSVAVNLRFGTFLSFNPTVSYQSTENFSDNSTSKIYNAYLSSELSFIPEVFSLSVSSSWTKNDNTFESITSSTTTLSAEGQLNLYLAKLFKQKVQPTFSLRGKYEEMKVEDSSNSNVTLYLQADLSF